jgi:hypothetical protein
MRERVVLIAALGLGALLAGSASGSVIYNNLTPNNQIAIAARPSLPGSFEIEAGDDFVATSSVSITSASFVGLEVPGTGGVPAVQDVVVEIYRVFPNDSDVGRTSGPPTFSTPEVPTRVNSPADVAFESRDSAVVGELTFTRSLLNPTFVADNSIQPGGIHPSPHQATGGNGPLTGQEVEFDVTLTTPFDLPPDHYFFVPQVSLSNGGQFYWLSASRPVSGTDIHGDPTTPFPAGFTDLQAWTRDAMLDPDWLRVGTDIVDTIGVSTAPTFNAAFSVNGDIVPEPASTVAVVIGLGLIGYLRWRKVTRGRIAAPSADQP